MRIVPQSVRLERITPAPVELIEDAGRICYQSTWKKVAGGAGDFVKMIWRRGHLSVLEHGSATIRFIVDRGVSHEMVRHRLASYSHESTRFCNYLKDQFGGEITVIKPPWKNDDLMAHEVWLEAMGHAEQAYMRLIALGQPPELARSVLPTCLKTEIVMTADFREWLHFLDLRNAPGRAHPQMIEVAAEAECLLVEACPEVFKLAEAKRRKEWVVQTILGLLHRYRDDKTQGSWRDGILDQCVEYLAMFDEASQPPTLP